MNKWQLTFESEDIGEVLGVVENLQEKLNPVGLMAFMHATVDPWLRTRTLERFNTEGDDVTGKWHPLTVATQHIRASAGFPPSHPINVRTGKMKNFLVSQASDVKPNGLGVTLTYPGASGDALTAEKIETAQKGKKTSPRTPPRPVLGVNENDMLYITSSLVAWLAEDYL